ncbi:hypothetical protein PR048_021108 [Dryococelus australis]|uniref:Uncharacterized protein n=1 Tax=Dryococelus australis TaxID=614101 RepID=A0ABQ9GXA3_9NEOP|nr:hypothetical protein PR048_021108 [Dryococelus australis]
MDRHKPNIYVGDYIRISKVNGTFTNGIAPNWTNELYKISPLRCMHTDPRTVSSWLQASTGIKKKHIAINITIRLRVPSTTYYMLTLRLREKERWSTSARDYQPISETEMTAYSRRHQRP